VTWTYPQGQIINFWLYSIHILYVYVLGYGRIFINMRSLSLSPLTTRSNNWFLVLLLSYFVWNRWQLAALKRSGLSLSRIRWDVHVCEVSNLLFTSSTSKGNFTYLYLTDLDKLLQSVLQTPYTATRVKNLIELGVITRNPKTLFKDILPRKFWQFTFLHVVHFRSNVNNVNR
jgi:hypothetical protein